MVFLEETRANEMILQGNRYLNFSSNDYLGYAAHPKVREAAMEAIKKYGAGGRSSRLISGTLDLHRQLEEKLAKFKGTESCLVFPTGFMANLAVLSALLSEGDAVIMDRLNHASLIDAAKLSRARIFVYDHCSLDSLEKVLHRTKNYKKRLVVTDSLFSMDGDFAPLAEIVELCNKHKVWLMIDDAHATGIFGKRGMGMAEHFGVLGKIEIVMGTLSKALGSQGGFVCGSKEMIDYLVNRARPFIYTTALSPASCGAALAALDLIQQEPEKRKKLLLLARDFREQLRKKYLENVSPLGRGGWNTQSDFVCHPFVKGESDWVCSEGGSQIIPFLTGSIETTLKFSEKLRESGIFVPAIRPPTVPKNQCRLRFSLTSEHSHKDIEWLLSVLEK